MYEEVSVDTPAHDYGRALSIDAEAIGRPGQRRFRLLVSSVSATACVWMEKEQLAGIGDWIRETVQRLDREQPNGEPDVEPSPFSAIFDLEFQAGQIGLGFLEQDAAFAIQAFEAGTSGNQPTFRALLSRGQARVLAAKIESVVAGGRPICPLCSMPMEPEGHTCPRTNGHHP
jgi:uncharacterized repeat protein (TIGR03847 family)